MKKKVGIIIVIVIVAIIIFLIASVLFQADLIPTSIREKLTGSSTELTDMKKIQKIITETYKTDVVVIGDDISFSEEVPYRKVTVINEDTLKRKENCEYTIFIINDVSEKVSISSEEQKLIGKLISEDRFCLIYIGSKYSTMWDDSTQGIASVDGNLFYMYYSVDGSPRRNIGAWTEQDQEQLEKYPDALGDTLMYNFEYYLEEIN